MPGKPVRIGPFTDGLNNVSLSGESKDTELVEMVNLEVGPDNLLWSRPPFEVIRGSVIDGTTLPAGGNWKILGIYRTTTTTWYVLVVKPKADGTTEIQAILNGDFSLVPTSVKIIPVGSRVTAFVQMNNDCYFCVSADSAISGFKWSAGGSPTDVTAMKKGNCMIAFKSRLWVSGVDTATQSSRIYFSAIGVGGPTPDIWNAVDFFDCAPGEGGFVTALLALNSSIVIFKNDGTWRFSFPSSPSKGQVDKLSGSVGAAGPTAVLEFENYVYVYDQGKVYELVNSSFTQLNRFVRFETDPRSVDGNAPGVDMSLVNRRIIVRYFNNIYAYSVDSKAWSQWRSYMGTPGRLYELPADSAATAPSSYVGASMATTQNVAANIVPAFTDKYRQMLAFVLTGGTISNVGTTFTVNTVAETIVYLNAEGKADDYNVKLSSKQHWRLTGNVTKTGGILTARLTCLTENGVIETLDTVLTTDAVDITIAAPRTAVAANIAIVHTGANQSYTMMGMQFTRPAVEAPVTIIKVEDQYRSTPFVVEIMDCLMRTKSYDFQAPSVIKRLFWWGADIKTNRIVNAKLIPMATKLPPKWGDLKQYTHLQLRQGTWGNPLSFLQVNLSVEDGADPKNSVTENGRIFVKLIKSLRFKQASFQLELSTLGNANTGPAKVHTLTAYVMPKEKVVDKFN